MSSNITNCPSVTKKAKARVRVRAACLSCKAGRRKCSEYRPCTTCTKSRTGICCDEFSTVDNQKTKSIIPNHSYPRGQDHDSWSENAFSSSKLMAIVSYILFSVLSGFSRHAHISNLRTASPKRRAHHTHMLRSGCRLLLRRCNSSARLPVLPSTPRPSSRPAGRGR